MKLGQWVVIILTMIVVLEFMGIATGINSTLKVFGININEDTHQLDTLDVESSNFWAKLFGAEDFTIAGITFSAGVLLVLLGGGAVIIGLFAKGYDPSLVILPIIVFVAGMLISTFWSVIKIVQYFGEPWATNLITTIFAGLAIGFIFACIDYFAGR